MFMRRAGPFSCYCQGARFYLLRSDRCLPPPRRAAWSPPPTRSPPPPASMRSAPAARAVDAAVAANAMLAVVYCNACGLGGDAFALVWDPGRAPAPRLQRQRPLSRRADDRGGARRRPRQDAGPRPAADHRARRRRRLGPAARPLRPPLPGRCAPARGARRGGRLRADRHQRPLDRRFACRPSTRPRAPSSARPAGPATTFRQPLLAASLRRSPRAGATPTTAGRSARRSRAPSGRPAAS